MPYLPGRDELVEIRIMAMSEHLAFAPRQAAALYNRVPAATMAYKLG